MQTAESSCAFLAGMFIEILKIICYLDYNEMCSSTQAEIERFLIFLQRCVPKHAKEGG